MSRSVSVSWQSRPLPPLVGGCALVLVGLVLMIGSWLWRERVTTFIATAAHSEATIVRIDRSSNSNSQFPVFTFADGDGRRYELRSSYTSNT